GRAKPVAEAFRGRGPPRRHARGDRAPAADIPRTDGASRRALPPVRQSGEGACGTDDRRGLEGNPGGPRGLGGPRMIIRKSAQEIEGMARAGELLYETLQLCA